MLVLCALGTLPRVFHVQADTLEFVLAGGEFQPEAGKFTLHLPVAVHGGDGFALRFALLLIDVGEHLLGCTQLGSGGFEHGLFFAHLMLKLHHFRVQGPQFALHPQRTRFIWAAARDHAALVAGAVGGNEGVL